MSTTEIRFEATVRLSNRTVDEGAVERWLKFELGATTTLDAEAARLPDLHGRISDVQITRWIDSP